MAAQRELLVSHFKKLGGKVELQRFDARDPRDGSAVPMANIIVRWNPEKQDRILLCGHYDTLPFPLRDPQNPRGRFVGANDNASGVAILMELAHDMKSLDLPFGVDFVLLDGEEFIFHEQGHYFLGSEHFAREYAAGRLSGRYRCGALLDMVGDADLQIYEEYNSVSWDDVPAGGRFDLGDRGAAGRAGIRPSGETRNPGRPRAAARPRRHPDLRRDRLRLSPLAHPGRHAGQMFGRQFGEGRLRDSRVVEGRRPPEGNVRGDALCALVEMGALLYLFNNCTSDVKVALASPKTIIVFLS